MRLLAALHLGARQATTGRLQASLLPPALQGALAGQRLVGKLFAEL